MKNFVPNCIVSGFVYGVALKSPEWMSCGNSLILTVGHTSQRITLDTAKSLGKEVIYRYKCETL